MIVKNCYTSVACNRTPGALDWGDDGLIYYGASHSIAVYDPKFEGSAKIIRNLLGHKARINTVKKIRNVPSGTTVDLISGSDDGTCILWDSRSESNGLQYVLEGHKKGVTHVDGYYLEDKLIVASTSADCTVKLWTLQDDTFSCLQTMDLNTGYCFALKFSKLPGSSSLLLAIANDNDSITLWTGSVESKFVQVESLQGHSDWVRGLDVIEEPGSGDLILASSSQDSFIRLWRISYRKELVAQKDFELLSADESIVLEERTFTISDGSQSFHYAVALESVLQGHEGWVYGVDFNRSSTTKGSLNLLSSSIDKTLTIWTPSESGIWFESVRVGEVGGGTLGFYGGKFSPDGRSIIGHGFQGSLHLWHQDPENPSQWKPGTIIGGHFEAARDLVWEPRGEFLVSLSADQTTRIHGCWKPTSTWHEIARPQVHGYDMQCLCLLSRYRLASAAEEKIVRVFQAPGNFVENFRQLCGVNDDPEGSDILKTTPKGASVPSLGLSNKAVYSSDVEPEPDAKHVKDMYPEHYFTPSSLQSPPTEETLMQNTLWPEMQKLYGHGYEIYSLAVTSDGRWVASASRATSVEHAKILIWNTTTWKIAQKLTAHQLTVTQLAFSPDNTKLLAVSRDRTLSVFENIQPNDEGCDFKLVLHTDKKNGVHARIIWCCSWAPDSINFVTGSRDGKVVLWEQQKHPESEAVSYGSKSVLELKGESITSLAFAHRTIEQDRWLLAIGLETGVIHLYSVQQDWKPLTTLDRSFGHHLTVKRLAFRPRTDDQLQLASCGEDNFVKIYDILY
ncbi:elongator complex protein 2 [Uranotaenia lowii]|uniref:elongator complex protein 2 n=1 Tax=Uranotaenia lowii TaxID=190385 RepID=UPI002478BBC6|nr:elongator complex protein 2 [Uranotaenia lowii]